ncbi:hypothetical protein MYCTH_2303475 [Thermothelomyces thermophilus ATCC 42464]|uniref:Mediator complex subunit 11 n=1 Tax=Thermothelomyces thermophilus (strain ATCC 42464 / BCRC 31852 / DSM 1799) TaxID=573729 RepID=G2QCW1_THET4|nr:uncharacterized protein MYCTH_2303475 [Thermothelomyces thermophilus ATCC 42464]AEO57381.1 hypothetical protein MYCTH_2303475 [Thermothelomyces thermophilus ATCC 42464]
MANNANNSNPSLSLKQPPAAKDSAEEEQQLEDMLARLDEVHLQLRQLRSALPRMLEPLTVKQPSPQAAFAAFMQSVNNTNKEVANFQEAYYSLITDGLFQRARPGQKSPRSLKQWRATEHPDWADPDKKRRRVV